MRISPMTTPSLQNSYCSSIISSAINNLIISSKMFLPVKSYTYISEAWHTVSWLDHCISTADAHASLVSMKICYELLLHRSYPGCNDPKH